MSATIEELPTTPAPTGRSFALRPAVAGGALGLRVHRTVADRPRGVHRRSDDRVARDVADRLQPGPSRDDQVRRHRQLRPDDERPDDRPVADRDPQVRVARHPGHDGREPRLRAVAQPPQAARQGSVAHARLHAVDDPARRLDARVDGLPQHRYRLAQRDPRLAGAATAGLDQQRDVDLPGAVGDRAVGDRQLHDHQHRRPPVGPDRAVRGGAHRRRGDLAVLPPDHDPADVAGAVLQPRDRPDRHLPVLHPGLRDDQRAG